MVQQVHLFRHSAKTRGETRQQCFQFVEKCADRLQEGSENPIGTGSEVLRLLKEAEFLWTNVSV